MCSFAQLSTHDNQTLEAVKATKLSEIAHLTAGVTVIGIDEGQFYEDIVQFTKQMADAGKTVVVAALDGTFERRPFGEWCGSHAV